MRASGQLCTWSGALPPECTPHPPCGEGMLALPLCPAITSFTSLADRAAYKHHSHVCHAILARCAVWAVAVQRRGVRPCPLGPAVCSTMFSHLLHLTALQKGPAHHLGTVASGLQASQLYLPLFVFPNCFLRSEPASAERLAGHLSCRSSGSLEPSSVSTPCPLLPGHGHPSTALQAASVTSAPTFPSASACTLPSPCPHSSQGETTAHFTPTASPSSLPPPCTQGGWMPSTLLSFQ